MNQTLPVAKRDNRPFQSSQRHIGNMIARLALTRVACLSSELWNGSVLCRLLKSKCMILILARTALLLPLAVNEKNVLLVGDQLPFMVQTIRLHAVTCSSFPRPHRGENSGVT